MTVSGRCHAAPNVLFCKRIASELKALNRSTLKSTRPRPTVTILVNRRSNSFSRSPYAVFGWIKPNTLYGDRLNELDLRFTKIVNVGGGRVDLNVDLFNAFNSDAIIVQNNAFGAAWQRPITVIQPRFVKFNVRWDF